VTRDLLEEGQEVFARACQTYRRETSGSLAMDTGTIHRRRFLDLILSSAGSSIPPVLYDAVERIRFRLSDDGEIVGNAITDLRKAGMKIKSIVGDNHPGQVMVLAHWSLKSVLINREPKTRAIRFEACICHVIQ
jgi:hypothetical protein